MTAVEPISSAMTYQAQITPKTTIQSDEDTAAQSVSKSAESADAAVKADAAILNVTESENIGSKESGEENKDSTNTADQNNTLVNDEQLKQAISKFNKSLNANTEAVFGIHGKTQRVMIKIIDKDTKKVIKEFPPEKTLDMLAKMWEMAGILVDEKG